MKDKIKFIEELAKSMNENKIEAVKYEDNNFEVSLTKKKKERNVIVNNALAQPMTTAPSNIPQEVQPQETSSAPIQEASSEEISGTQITSPMVGTFYASPSPTAAPFVKEGDSVKEGQTLCIVEAMKLMNEVKSTVSGKIKKVLVKDKDSIKKGQALFIVE